MVYRCTLCGECNVSCPVSIDTKNLWLALRETLVEMGHYPKALDTLKSNLEKFHNILGNENGERAEWIQSLTDLPEHLYQKEKAQVAFFVGCVASFFPMAKKIPRSFAEILIKAGVDFTLLGGEEWCCGFPLIGAGMKKEAEALIRHNLEKMKEKGVRTSRFCLPIVLSHLDGGLQDRSRKVPFDTVYQRVDQGGEDHPEGEKDQGDLP